MKTFKEIRNINEAKGLVADHGGYSTAVLIDGINPQDALKLNSRDVLMKIKEFKAKAKQAWAGSKGKKTIPAVKKEIKLQGAKQYYARWKSDSSSYKDDSVQIWFTK